VRQFEIVKAARADMTEIWLYIAADNEQAADRLDDQLKERMQRLAEIS